MKSTILRPSVLVIVTVISWLATVAASPVGNESINYRVMFKWGLVNKQAGTVNLSTHVGSGGTFDARLTARSAKWADRFYTVRDTLLGRINSKTGEPLFYEKITHEGGHYKHDRIDYRRHGSAVEATCRRVDQPKPGDPVSDTTITLEAEGLTLDMLSAYYYMRQLDYESMSPGESVTLTVFSGKRKETLTIKYVGRDKVTINNVDYPTYAISFRFTGKGGKKTSDDMQAWLSTSQGRLPLKLVGKLPVGRVECYYIPPVD